MEENVALDSSKQKDFVKSIKGIKKLIKKTDIDKVLLKKSGVKSKHGKSSKPIRKPRGLVYLAHIPHGFYEHEMTEYFKQFGCVTNVRVIRSKRTGRSKGYGFVEFKDPAVGEIVAETMNNYLMGKRLIKAEYIPPEKQRHWAKRKNWNTVHNPTSEVRLKVKKQFNSTKNENEDMKLAKTLLSGYRKSKQKLVDIGINYDFFTPVDIPEGIDLDHKSVVKKEKATVNLDKPDEKSKIKKKSMKEAKKVEVNNDDVKKANEEIIMVQDEKPKKKKKKPVVDSNKEQELKETKIKTDGIIHVQNYIRIKRSHDSDKPEKVNEQQSSPQLKRKANQKTTPDTLKKYKFKSKNSQKLPLKSFKKKK